MALADKFLPTDLPGQVAAMLKALSRIEQAIVDLKVSLAPAPAAPESETVWRALPVNSLGQGANVVTVIASGDTAGLYSIQAGTSILFQFRLQANATAIFEFPMGRHLGIPAGLKISLNLPNGATGEATIVYRPREGAR